MKTWDEHAPTCTHTYIGSCMPAARSVGRSVGRCCVLLFQFGRKVFFSRGKICPLFFSWQIFSGKPPFAANTFFWIKILYQPCSKVKREEKPVINFRPPSLINSVHTHTLFTYVRMNETCISPYQELNKHINVLHTLRTHACSMIVPRCWFLYSFHYRNRV